MTVAFWRKFDISVWQGDLKYSVLCRDSVSLEQVDTAKLATLYLTTLSQLQAKHALTTVSTRRMHKYDG